MKSGPWTSFYRGSSPGLKRGNKPLKKWHIRQSAERVTRSIDESLERLQLDYVDILQCHDIEFGSLDQIVNETIPALQKLKQVGKIRFIVLQDFLWEFSLMFLIGCHQAQSMTSSGINDSTLEDLPDSSTTELCQDASPSGDA